MAPAPGRAPAAAISPAPAPPPPPRAPLPFGLGSPPTCSSSRCLFPNKDLPKPGTPLCDQTQLALSRLFSTFYATSLRYLGVSEILDWIESNRTVDAWILTGLEQGRSPTEIGSAENLSVGRGAIMSVIKAALAQDDEAWATSLREVGFSSGMSMAYEGIVSQLKPTSNSPLPCLHSLLSPAGLAMLKSAPLKHAFPICPPRPPPSPTSLLSSIRSLLSSPSLAHLRDTPYRQPIRRAFQAYHSLVLSIAEELVTAPSFSTQYTIFLSSISQPLQLLQLIADDFEDEFGPGACRGLLGVGDVGGRNINQVMSFCRSGKPSELLERVRARVRERKKAEQEGRSLPPLPPVPAPQASIKDKEKENRDVGCIQGSSKDLLRLWDPFASTAPRAEGAPMGGRPNGKGKGKALPPPVRYVPPLAAKPSSAAYYATPPSTPPPSTHAPVYSPSSAILNSTTTKSRLPVHHLSQEAERPQTPSSVCSCECEWDDDDEYDDDEGDEARSRREQDEGYDCCPDCIAAGRV